MMNFIFVEKLKFSGNLMVFILLSKIYFLILSKILRYETRGKYLLILILFSLRE